MKRSVQTAILAVIGITSINCAFSQTKMTEKEMIGNWLISGGSGQDFDKDMIGQVITLEKDHKAQRMEDGEKLEADWKFENNVITFTTYYNDGINDPEIETLTITGYKEKILTANYADDDDAKFVIILERTNVP